MSNLGNQYISASYQSVLNVGTGSGDYITSTLKPLTDGYGTSVPIKVSTTSVELSGSISLTGSLVSSIIPAVSNSIDLGSPTKPFRHLYVGSGSIYLDDHQVLSLDLPGTDTTIAAPPSGTVQLLNDVVFSSQEGLGYQGAPGFTIVGGGTQYVSQTRYSGDTISYHTGSHFKTNYWVNNLNQITGATSLELDYFKDNLKLATIENSRHLPTYEDSQYIVTSIYEGTGSYNGVISFQHLDRINSEYSQLSIGDDSVYLGAGNLSGSSPIPQSNFYVTEQSIRGDFSNQASSASFQLTGSLFEVTGAIKATDGYIGNVQGTASFASNANSASYASTALSASFAQDSDVANSAISAISADTLEGTGSAVFATTGSNTFNGSQTISGSLNVTGSITALSASITYLQTIYQTSSVIFTSGSNILGDEASDVQTLNGTVNVPLGNLNVTGATTASAGFFGNLQGTASYASNALSASQAQNAVSASQAQNAVSSSHSTYAENAGLLNGTGSGVFATTGSNVFFGQETINVIDPFNIGLTINSGSGAQAQSIYFQTNEFGGNSQPTVFLNGINTYLQSNGNMNFENAPGGVGSGSINFTTNGDLGFTTNGTGKTINFINNNGSINLRPLVNITGSLNIRSGSLSTISNNTTINIDNYLTSSLGGQSNIILGWGDNPNPGGAGASQANYTGSLRITGSNNIVSMPQIRQSLFLAAWAGHSGYISGSHNWINGNNAGIFMSTGSLLPAKTSGNVLGFGSSIGLSFTSSSLAAPTIQQNTIYGGQINLVHNSGSAAVGVNLLNGGAISSTQAFVTNTAAVTSGNLINGNTIILNHLSSSIVYATNISNAQVTINNAVSSSITNNTLTVGGNAFLGSSHTIFASGSQSSNVTRNITNNLLGGVSINVSSSAVSSSNANLISTIAYGNNLHVSASHNAGTNGGSAFFGRFNDTGSLALAQDIVFAVGSGLSNTQRRTTFWIDSGSAVFVSSSLNVIGAGTNVMNVTGGMNISSSAAYALDIKGFNTNITGALNVTGSSTIIGNTNITGSLGVSGSVTIANAGDLTMYGHKMFNAGQFWSNTTQSGSAGVSGSLNFDASGSIAGVSLVSGSRLTVANGGTYNVQFSAQIETSAGADSAYVWFKKNGTNIGDSATKVTLANNTAQVMTVNILDDASANDYYELGYQFTNGNATVLAEAASGNIPAIPSVIATVTQAR